MQTWRARSYCRASTSSTPRMSTPTCWSQVTQSITLTCLGPSWQIPRGRAGQPMAFQLAAFTVDWAAHKVMCPEGHSSVKWCPTHDRHGNDVIHIEFAAADCRACPSRLRCTRAVKEPREMGLRPQAQQEALWAARQRQTTASFKEEYARRAGVEGTLSQAIHVCDLRRAKYIGLAKTRLQHVITAAALNVVRVGAWLAGVPPC